MLEDYPTTSATVLASTIRAGTTSPVDVVQECLSRIDKFDDEINAFITVEKDEAIRQAEIAEQKVDSNDQLGALHGVPIAIKDLTPVAGMKTTFGSRVFSSHVSKKDDLFVDRLRSEGAIIIGKTNTPEFGRLTVTTNKLTEPTRNPWDVSRTVGGSSGGSAAAVAAGLVPVATGTDAAGSIRVPSSACGVFGFFPDFGRIPVSVRPDAYTAASPYSGSGPITRSVEDAAVLMDIMCGPHQSDPFSLPRPEKSFGQSIHRPIDDLQIVYSHNLGISPINSEVRAVIESALEPFESSGAMVEQVSGIFSDTWERLHDAIEILLQFRYLGIYEGLKETKNIDLLRTSEDVTEEVVNRVEKALELDPIDIRRAQRIRTKAIDDIKDIFAKFDLIITPTLGLPPFPLGTRPTEIDGISIDPLHGWILTWPFNLTGNPAASLPAGFSSSGLPIGMQIIGQRLSDHLVLSASAAYERKIEWDESYTKLQHEF